MSFFHLGLSVPVSGEEYSDEDSVWESYEDSVYVLSHYVTLLLYAGCKSV